MALLLVMGFIGSILTYFSITYVAQGREYSTLLSDSAQCRQHYASRRAFPHLLRASSPDPLQWCSCTGAALLVSTNPKVVSTQQLAGVIPSAGRHTCVSHARACTKKQQRGWQLRLVCAQGVRQDLYPDLATMSFHCQEKPPSSLSTSGGK